VTLPVYWTSTFTPADVWIFVVSMLVFLGPATAWLLWIMLRHDAFVDRLADAIDGRRLSFLSNPNLVTGSIDGIPCACHYAVEWRGGPNILRIRLRMQFARRAIFEARTPSSDRSHKSGDTAKDHLRAEIDAVLSRAPDAYTDMMIFGPDHAELTLYDPRPDLDLSVISRFAAIARELTKSGDQIADFEALL